MYKNNWRAEMSTKKKSKVNKKIIIGIILFAVLSIVIYKSLQAKPLAYESVKAKTSDIITYYHFSGNVDASQRQTIMSENIMQISDILVSEGDIVEEGDVLLKTSSGKKIKSKINGEIAEIYVEEDQQVMAAMELIKIVDYNNLEINVKIDEYDIGAVEVGMEAIVSIHAIDKEITGTISTVSKEGIVENGVTFFIATIDLEPDENIKIGMSTEVRTLSQQVTGVVTLPMSAIQFDKENKPFVQKKQKDEMVKVEIETGINDGSQVEIIKGVSSDEAVYYLKANPTEEMMISGGNRGNGGGSR